MNKIPLLTGLLAVIACGVHLWPAATELFQFDRAAIIRGQLWRLLTGHFAHFGYDHLKWDVLALMAFGSVVELRSRNAWALGFGLGGLAISCAILCFQPQFSTYRGLSGIDSAFFAFVIAQLFRESRHADDHLSTAVASLALGGFLVKCGYELVTGDTVFVAESTAFEPVPLAHLIGASVGISVAYRESLFDPKAMRASLAEGRA